ncbi:MAG: TonB-dependent receptor [Bacteroidia bacterium]|nr:TonB-dependent receptor [Bacteroidia bacterium]
MKIWLYCLLAFSFLIYSSTLLSAQGTERQWTRENDSLYRNRPMTGRLFGKITEAENGQPVEYASVAVYRDSTLVGGGLSDEKGKFDIGELPFGKLSLRITCIGFTTQTAGPFVINPAHQEVDAGIVKINTSAAKLKEVDITADRPDFINSIDRKVYNVEKDIVNTGGTVTEVLQNIPSVTVDIDGNVSLRGSENVTILIDGKPSGILGGDKKAVLDQLPASAIEQVEVMTNPSAKYDAEGMSGIINIKTRKDKLRGSNGSVSAGIGTNDKYNINVAGNNRGPKNNLYFNYTYRNEKRGMTGESTQYNYFPGQEPYSYNYTTQGTSHSSFNTGKLGADFYLDHYNTLSINGGISARNDSRPDQTDYLFYDNDNRLYDTYFRNETDDAKNNGIDAGLDYKRTWKNSARELSTSAGYSSNHRTDHSGYSSSLYDNPFTPYQVSNNDNRYQSLLAQADLLQPAGKNSKIETGLKTTTRYIDNTQDVLDFNFQDGNYTGNNMLSDHFKYSEQVVAGYAMFTSGWKKFDYNAGIRVEQTLTDGTSYSQKKSFSHNYLSFFPSAYLRYNFTKSRQLELNYTRRIDRPDTRSLNPYTDYSDSLNLRTGNPYINPEYIHSLELSYAMDIGNLSLTNTVYYRHTDDLISRIRMADTATGVTTFMPINFSSSDNTGFEAILRYQLEKSGSIMLSFNIYQNKINGNNVQPDLQSNNTQWNTRLNANLRLARNTAVQVSGYYHSPNKTPTGQFQGWTGMDAGIRQDIWKSKGSIGFNVTDIFNTRKFRFTSFSDYFNSSGTRRRESRVAMLTLSYRFGNQDSNLFGRKKSRQNSNQQDNSNQQPDMMDF